MTDQEFSVWWNKLCAKLRLGAKIQHWSVTEGLKVDSFVVRHIAANYIQIEGPKDRIYQRTISAYDFRQVLIDWHGYRVGRVSRKTIDAASKHSTYVIGMIHWMETATSPSSTH